MPFSASSALAFPLLIEEDPGHAHGQAVDNHQGPPQLIILPGSYLGLLPSLPSSIARSGCLHLASFEQLGLNCSHHDVLG